MPKVTTSKSEAAWQRRAASGLALLAKLDKRAWTDEEIASGIGISFNTVRRWRSGTVPQSSHLALLKKLVDGVTSGAIERPKPLVA